MAGRIVLSFVVAAVALDPAASAARPGPFAGQWWGHTRSLHVDASGRGREFVDDGCCRHLLDLDYRLLSVRRTGATTTARVKVTAIRIDRVHPRVHVGQVGTLRLRRGVILDSLSDATFCAPTVGRCGA